MSIEELTEDARRSFRVQFKEARAKAFSDAENFHDILYTLERLGQTISPRNLSINKRNLAGYENAIKEIANESPLASKIKEDFRYLHTPFDILYGIVRKARNEALHQGAYARHLTTHATELSLILEDSMTTKLKKVSDFMVRNVICAELWQPVSYVRQIMLANNFSFIPFQTESKEWCFISDILLVNILSNRDKREETLNSTLEQIISEGKINPKEIEAEIVDFNKDLHLLLSNFKKEPFLICKDGKVIGIITAFDVM